MTKTRLQLIFLLIGLSLAAQKRNGAYRVYGPGLDINIGYRIPQNNFYNQLNSTSNFDFNKPLRILTLGGADHLSINTWDSYRQVSYTQIIPQDITVYDSVSCNIRGSILSAGTSINILHQSKRFKPYLGVGLNAGWLKISQPNVINKTTPILTPKVFFAPTLFLNHVYLQLTCEYHYDFLNLGWTSHGANQFDNSQIQKISQTCFTALFGIGYSFK